MPLPWKKTKISRLVADHIESQKRLETGFPTSLVDLFVKNRDRLKKKPSKKKKPSASDPPITPSLSTVSHRNPCSTLSVSESTDSRKCSTSTANLINTNTDTFVGDSSSQDVRQNVPVSDDAGAEESGETAYPNRVRVAVLKMFVVLVLALGTKRFVIWITVSTFLLFFLEYVGKYLFRIYMPSSNSQNLMELLAKKLLPFQIINVTSEIETNSHKEEKPIVYDSSVVIQSSKLNTSTAEIKNLEQSEFNFLPSVEQTRTSKSEDFNQIISLLELANVSSKVSEVKWQKGRRSKMAKVGSKMKKLVPKNFGSSKKKHVDSKNVINSSIEKDQCQYQAPEQEQEKQNCAQLFKLESKDKSLMVSAEKSDRAEEVVDAVHTSMHIVPKDWKAETDPICSCRDSKATEVAKEVKRKTVGNLRYWFICLIVLAGLVGGKILALGLTLCWCLVLKSGVIPRKYIKDPMFS